MRDALPTEDTWLSAMSLLQDTVMAAPADGTNRVRYGGVAVGNAAVAASADTVHLIITHTRHRESAPTATSELSMPPDFARYLAVLLDSHARYIQSRPT